MCPTRQPHWVFELPEDSRWHLVHDVLQNIWNKQLRTENVCVRDHVRLFEMTHCELRIRRYLPCCDDEAVHTSGLRNVREADFKWSNLQSGGSNFGNIKTDNDWWKICWLKVKLDLFLFFTSDSPAGLCGMWPSAPPLPAHWWCHVCVGGALPPLTPPLADALHTNSEIYRRKPTWMKS